jgi:prefoldin subunit 5
MLLSSLQQSVREMSQQVFALNAQVKALNLQCQGIPTLKDRCTHLENALAAMEEMIAPH